MKRKLSGIIHIQSKNPPIVELDSEAHAAYVRFSSNRVARTELITDNGCIVTVDRDRRGNAIGVEFVGVDTFNIESLLRKARVRISKSLSQRASYIPAEHDLVAA